MRKEIAKLIKERDHWIANHNGVVKQKRNSDEYKEFFIGELKIALSLLNSVVEPGSCRWSQSRPFKGETCGEFLTQQQGVTMEGCDLCRANDFLENSVFSRKNIKNTLSVEK